MAKISSADYNAISSQADSMRNTGKSLNSEFTSAYSSIGGMHNSWYGQRYNKLVEAFNEMIEDINEMLSLVVDEIPYALLTIANNYSQADKGENVKAATNEEPEKITSLTITEDVGMRFLTSEVQSVQSNVNSNFENARSDMDTIESLLNDIDWESEAADAFKSKFNSLKTSICESLETIKEDFKTLMDQAQQDIENAETANTVS